MQRGTFALVAALAMSAAHCGGSDGSTHLQHPNLDQDYSNRFAGTWQGSVTLTFSGQPPQTTFGNQRIDRTEVNRLSISQVCPEKDGAAGLDSSTTFSMDPVSCAPVQQQCGGVTIRYDNGTATLDQNTLTMTLHGNGSGCGQSINFTLVFTGHLTGSAACTPVSGAGPASPPAGLWEPAAGSTPASGNYVYLESEAGDYIGLGAKRTFTPANESIGVSSACQRVSVNINQTTSASWSGDFQGMNGLTQLQPGYYGNLQRYPFHDPSRGGLDWIGEGRGCNTVSGWFVVDSVTYTSGTVSAIDLRFEQHCEGATPALHGKIHWTVSGTRARPHCGFAPSRQSA